MVIPRGGPLHDKIELAAILLAVLFRHVHDDCLIERPLVVGEIVVLIRRVRGVFHNGFHEDLDAVQIDISRFLVVANIHAVPRIALLRVRKVEHLYSITVVPEQLCGISIEFAFGVGHDHGFAASSCLQHITASIPP